MSTSLRAYSLVFFVVHPVYVCILALQEPQVLSFSPTDLLNVPTCLLCLAPLLPSTQGPDSDANPFDQSASLPLDQSTGLAPTPSSEVPPPIMLIAVDSSLLVLNPTDGNCSVSHSAVSAQSE